MQHGRQHVDHHRLGMGASAEVAVRRVRQAAGVLANCIAQAPQALLSVGQRRVGRGGKG